MEIDIEKIVLSQLLISDRQDQVDFYTQLGEKYFYDSLWKNYFNAFGRIVIIHKEPLDQLSIYNECKNEAWFDLKDLTDLFSHAVNNADIERNIAILKERSYRKELIRTVDIEVIKLKETKWHDDLEDQKNKLIAKMDSVQLDKGSEFVDFTISENKLKKNMNSKLIREGYSWGINDLDILTSGITVPKKIVIGGLKKGGKSRFVINTRYALAKQGVYTPFLSLEMPEMELAKLHYARELKIPDHLLRSGAMLNPQQVAIIKEFQMDWTYYPTECLSNVTLDQVLARIRKYSKLFPNCVIFLDYIQRIRHDRNRQATELEAISTALADATREHKVTIISLAQLSNLAEREEPTIGHLKGSGGIGEGADTIILLDNLYRRTKEEDKRGQFRLIIEQRYGDSGVINIGGDLGICHYYDDYKITKFEKILKE